MENNNRRRHSAEIQRNSLTPEYASRILYYSFKFSQGNGLTHRNLFRYIHALRPEWTVSEDDRRKIYEYSLGPVMKFVLPNDNIINNKSMQPMTHPSKPRYVQSVFTKEDIESDLKSQIDNMAWIMNEDEPGTEGGNDSWSLDKLYKLHTKPKEYFVPRVTKYMIEKDHEELLEEHGRMRDNPDTSIQSLDPWSSLFIEHALLHKPTGVLEFDQLFVDMRKYLKEERGKGSNSWKDIASYLQELIPLYEEKHPDVKVSLLLQ